jgi:cell division initiation protein
MFERIDQTTTPSSTSAANAGSPPPERVMRIAPMDLRQQRFRIGFRGFDQTEVVAFLTEAAADYEHALREIDRLRQDLVRTEALLGEHREREANLRNTLLTAQRLADEVKEAAQNEARIIIRDAEGRAETIVQRGQSRVADIEREINELRLRRRGVEGSLESSIQTLYHALEFIRDQDKQVDDNQDVDRQDRPDEKVLIHRPRQSAEPPAAIRTASEIARSDDRLAVAP